MKINRRVSAIYYLLSFFIPVIIILVALIGLKIAPFGDNTLAISDGNALYLNFLSYVSRAIKGQEGILYSFEKGLGGNMMDSWGWFLLNPTFALFLLFDVTQYMTAFMLVSMLNFSLCGLTMYILLKDIYDHRSDNLIFSTAYALSGFMVANVFQMNFFTGVTVLPLMVLGLRRILSNRNPVIYIFSLAWSLLTNFYFGYMLCVTSVLIFTSFFIADWERIENRGAIALKYVIASLLAGALSSFVWLPALLALRGGRLDQSVLHAISLNENMPFLDMFSKLFTGANSTNELKNGLPNIFVGVLPVFLGILFFMNRKIGRRRKAAAAFLLSFYLISFYITVFNLVMHGGTVTNWFNYRDSFIFSFLLLMIAAEEWRHIGDEPGQALKHTAIILIVGTLIVFSKQYEYVSGGMVLIDFTILAVMFLAYRMHKKDPINNPKRVFTLVVLILMCINCFLNYYFSVKNVLKWSHMDSDYQATVMPIGALVDAVKMSDKDFYRMEVGEQYSEVGNDPMLYGYYGVGHGGSDDKNIVRTALSELGIHRVYMRNFYGKGVTAPTDALLGLRYIISKEDLTEEKGYEKLVYIGKWSLYKNPNALPVALISDSKIEDVQIDIEDVFDNLNRTWSAMAGIDQAIFIEEDDISFTSHNITAPLSLSLREAEEIVQSRDKAWEVDTYSSPSEYKDYSEDDDPAINKTGTFATRPDQVNYISFTWTSDRDGAYYSYNRSGVTEDNGSVLPALNYEGYLHEGETITRYLPVTGSLVTEYLLEEVAGRFKIACVDDEALKELSAVLLDRDSSIEKLKDSHLRGEFTVEAGQKLMLTIPYDEGWICRIDGEKVPIEKALGLFMIVEAVPGHHTFEMMFVPAGWIPGCIISLIGLTLLPAFILLDRRRRRILPRPKEERKTALKLSDEKVDGQCFSKKDWLYAGVVALAVLVIAAGSLTSGTTEWGDDSFAYISEGISITKDTFDEQTRINYQYHPTQMPDESTNGRLVYVWGYPLIQSLVYRLVGFDFDTIVWYKLPLLLALSLTGGALTLFFRRRFSIRVAAFMAFIFCMGRNFIYSVNSLYSDLLFLFFSMLSLLMMECYCHRLSHERNSAWLGVIYGIVMWMTWETRLSGYTVCAAAFIGHAIVLVGQRKKSRRRIAFHILPYALLCVLVLLSERVWLAPATSNLSDINGATIGFNLRFYGLMVSSFMAGLTGLSVIAIGAVLCAFCVAGIVVAGFKKNLHLTLLLVGTLVVDILLPYTQGLRYLFNILPIMLMFVTYGISFAAKTMLRIGRSGVESDSGDPMALSTVGRVILCAVTVFMLALTTAPNVISAANNLAHWSDRAINDVYSEEAREVYRYIQDGVPADEIVAFAKPRLLYLNTGHMSFRPGVNDHELSDADYYLLRKQPFLDYQELDLKNIDGEIVLDNAAFALYRLKNEKRL